MQSNRLRKTQSTEKSPLCAHEQHEISVWLIQKCENNIKSTITNMIDDEFTLWILRYNWEIRLKEFIPENYRQAF